MAKRAEAAQAPGDLEGEERAEAVAEEDDRAVGEGADRRGGTVGEVGYRARARLVGARPAARHADGDDLGAAADRVLPVQERPRVAARMGEADDARGGRLRRATG